VKQVSFSTDNKHGLPIWGLHVLVLGVVALISFRLFASQFPLRIDLPNHLARHAIQCGGALGENYAAYYSFSLRALPNLAADMVYSFDFACNDIFLTNRLITQVSILNFIASVYLLHFAIWRKVSLWPVAATLLVYNTPFSYGFENYLFSVPFTFHLFALWVLLSEKPVLWRLGLTVPLAFGLYFLHIFAFGFFLVLVAGWELGRQWNAADFSWSGFAARLLGGLLLVVPAGLHFTLFRLIAVRVDAPSAFGWVARVDAMASITMPGGQGAMDTRGLLPMAVLLFIGIVLLWGFRTGRLRVDGRMKFALLLGFLAALLAPMTYEGVAFMHVRYPFMVLAALIAASRWQLSSKVQAALVVAVLAIFALRTELLREEWLAGDAQVREMIAATEALPAGSGIFLLRDGLTGQIVRHSHTLAYAGIFNDLFVPTLFYGTNPLSLTADNPILFGQQYFPRSVAQVFAYMRGERQETGRDDPETRCRQLANLPYFLVLGDGPLLAAPLPDGVEMLHQGSYFSLLKSDTSRWQAGCP